jgi:hypothetical protein
MRRFTVFFLTWLLMSSAIFAMATEPCRTRTFDFGQKTEIWEHLPLSTLKKDTVYTLSQEDGRTVLRGTANSSASLFVSRFQSAMEVPMSINWRWKTGSSGAGC